MGSARDYREFAARCLEMARHSADAHVQAVMLQMAQVWHRLADEAASSREQHDRQGAPNAKNSIQFD